MKLFVYDHCPFCSRPLMLIGLKQLPVEVEVIMENDVETPTRMVGRKVVPILQKDDGSHLPESMDIVHYLDQLSPPTVIGTDSQPAIDAWVERTWKLSLQLAVPRYTRADFRELATPAAREAFIAREIRAFGDLQALLDDTPRLLAELRPLLQELEGLLLPGQDISETDFRLFPLLRGLSIVKDLQFGPNVQRYVDDLAQRCRLPLFTALAQ